MARKKTEIELQKARLLTIVRTAIRLRHTLAINRELLERLPEIEADFDSGILAGELAETVANDIIARELDL